VKCDSAFVGFPQKSSTLWLLGIWISQKGYLGQLKTSILSLNLQQIGYLIVVHSPPYVCTIYAVPCQMLCFDFNSVHTIHLSLAQATVSVSWQWLGNLVTWQRGWLGWLMWWGVTCSRFPHKLCESPSVTNKPTVQTQTNTNTNTRKWFRIATCNKIRLVKSSCL